MKSTGDDRTPSEPTGDQGQRPRLRDLEDQLRQAQKMEAIGRLAGGVAHDFNNHLTTILGYTELLTARMAEEPEVLEELGEIQRAAERAATLTHQLLAFSRKQLLVPSVLDLGAVVQGLSGMLRRLIGEDIQVDVVIAPDLGRVEADAGQMEQIVMNLAVNSRDAMPDGGRLLFELRNVDVDTAYGEDHLGVSPGPYVLLAVADDGLGMSAEVRKRIFEPFFTTKEKGRGTGLGLSTVYGIVSQSGGSIWVYSEPGRGTTFKIYLPRVDRTAVARAASDPVIPAAEGQTILLVEDEDQLRLLVKRLLTKLGFRMLVASSPAEALSLVQDHDGPLDLVLTDVVMPGMSGRDLARLLLRDRPETRVLYMSGYTDDHIAHHGMLEPGVAFLEKPFTSQRLADKVHQALRKRRPTDLA